MGFFSKARDMYALQKQAKGIKKELKNIHIEAMVDGVTVVVTGEQDVISVAVEDAVWEKLRGESFGKKKLEETFVKAVNKALKKAQELGSAKMKGVWNQLGVNQ